MLLMPFLMVFAALGAEPAPVRPAAAEDVLIFNESGGAVRLAVDGEVLGTLSAGKSRAFSLPAGRHQLVASYTAFGEEVALVERSLWVRGGWSGAVHVPAPRTAPVLVRNETGADAQVRINGVAGPALAAGERVVVEVPLGAGLVELVKEKGRLLDRETVEAVAFAPVEVVATADFGALRVNNPTEDTLAVRVGGQLRPVPAGGTALIDGLPIGPVAVDFLLPAGWQYGEAMASVGAGKAAELALPAPVEDAVVVVSGLAEVGAVWVDGVAGGTLPAGERLRLALAPGKHRVIVKDDDGATLFSRSVRVEEGERVTLKVAAGMATRPARPQRPGAPR